MSVVYVDESWENWDASHDCWYGAVFEKCKIKSSFFDETDCTEIIFNESVLDNVDFSLSYLWDGKFFGCRVLNSKFDKTKIKGCKFQNCIFNNVDFFALEHNGSLTFEDCEFVNSNFVGMTDYEIESFTFKGCTFDRKTLTTMPASFKKKGKR